MSNFLGLLPMDLSRIEEFIEPRDEVDEDDGEEVVGDMTDEQRRMYTKVQLLIKECLNHCGSKMIPNLSRMIGAVGSSPEVEEVLAEANEAFSVGNELRTKMQVLTNILDVVVKDEFSLWGPNWEVGYRKGFKIVKYKTM